MSSAGPGHGGDARGEVGCVVVAAGAGRRLGAELPKAFVDLGGVTLLEHAVTRTLDVAGHVVAVVPADLVEHARSLLERRSLREGRVLVVAGGADRRASVALGMQALAPPVITVLVHDAARALAPSCLAGSVIDAVRAGAPAVVPGLVVADTLKTVDGDVVTGTVDRASLRAVQTPQGFARSVLERAHREVPATDEATDDAGLVEALGEPVVVVPGHPRAFKITTAADLDYARWLCTRQP